MTALRTLPRRLLDSDIEALRRLVDADPVGQCVMAARLQLSDTLAPRVFGGEVWGVADPDDSAALTAACFAGGSVIPVGTAEVALRLLAGQLAVRPRSCSSIVGPADGVAALWDVLAAAWGPCRSIRPVQPLLVTRTVPALRADPHVRIVRRDEWRRYLPAAEAMFAEELGVRPVRDRSPGGYRGQVERLIEAGRALARFDDAGRVIFKAEVAAVSDRCAQIQGVWVAPEWRGQRIGTHGMVAVLRYALRLAPAVSLYVNDYNHPARAMYRTLGLREVGTLATVLF